MAGAVRSKRRYFSGLEFARHVWVAVLALLLGGILVLPGFGQAGASPSVGGTRGGILRVAYNAEGLGPDPGSRFNRTDRHLALALYDTLFTFDDKLHIKPGLVASWEQRNPTEYIWRLQKGVRFHDGAPFNAAAVKFNIDRVKDPNQNAPSRSLLDTIASVSVIDELTVGVQLTEPSVGIFATLADFPGLMVSPKAVEKWGRDYAGHPTGTGPFIFVEWIRDQRLVVRRNPNYWLRDASGNQLPYLDRVVFRPIPDPQAKLTALQTGQVDVIDNVPITDLATARQQVQLVQGPPLGYVIVWLNVAKVPFNDVRIRKALAWAADRDAIVRTALLGTAKVAQGPIPPASWAYDPRFVSFSQRDVEKARQLLQEAGQSRVSFEMMFPNQEPFVSVAQILKNNWAEVGVDAVLAQREFPVLLQRAFAKNFDALIIDYSGRIDPDVALSTYFQSGGLYNPGAYSNPEVDRLLSRARAAANIAERTRVYRQIQRIVMEDSPYIILYHDVITHGAARNVRNYQLLADGLMRLTGVSLQR